METTFENIVSEEISCENHLNDKNLSLEFLDIFTNTDLTYESYLTESYKLFLESTILFKDNISIEDNVKLYSKLKTVLGEESTNIVMDKLDKFDNSNDGFIDRMVDNLKKIIHKMILSIGNFIRSVVNYIKGSTSKYISYFYKTKMKDVKKAYVKNKKHIDLRYIDINSKNNQEIYNIDPMVILDGLNKFTILATNEFNNNYLNPTSIRSFIGNLTTATIKEVFFNQEFRKLFLEMKKSFSQASTLKKLEMKNQIPTIGKIKRCILYDSIPNIKHQISYSLIYEQFNHTLSDSFISKLKFVNAANKNQLKTLTRMMNSILKSEKELKKTNPDLYKKEVFYYNTCKHVMIMVTGLSLSIVSDMLSMRNKTYSVCKKILKINK